MVPMMMMDGISRGFDSSQVYKFLMEMIGLFKLENFSRLVVFLKKLTFIRCCCKKWKHSIVIKHEVASTASMQDGNNNSVNVGNAVLIDAILRRYLTSSTLSTGDCESMNEAINNVLEGRVCTRKRNLSAELQLFSRNKFKVDDMEFKYSWYNTITHGGGGSGSSPTIMRNRTMIVYTNDLLKTREKLKEWRDSEVDVVYPPSKVRTDQRFYFIDGKSGSDLKYSYYSFDASKSFQSIFFNGGSI